MLPACTHLSQADLVLLRRPHLDAGPRSEGQAEGYSQVHLCSQGRQVIGMRESQQAS